ncbi:MAG: hypothetical protein WC538_11900 [Thermoanaerobaculia bacterium]
MRMIVLSLCTAWLVGCATLPPASQPMVSAEELRISAAAYSRDGSTLWYVTGRETCELSAIALADRSTRSVLRLDWCPTRISPVDAESFVLTDGVRRGEWKRSDGTDVVAGSVLAASSATNYVRVDGERLIWVRDSKHRDIGVAGVVTRPTIVPATGDLFAVIHGDDGEHIERMTADGASIVGAAFPKIDSFDVAPRGEELVFSAIRDGNFDVAIASTDGKKVNWVPSDRADEVAVTWAPRGNKVSFLIRRPDTTLVRSVHVPTSFQLTFETPLEKVRALAWEPRAERLAMILDGPVVPPHVDSIEYSGANRESLVQPGRKLVREPERIAFGAADAILIPPRTVRYGEKVPLFVTLSDEPLAWDDASRDLDALGGGMLRLRPGDWAEGAPLAQVVTGFPWAGADQVVVIVESFEPASASPVPGAGQTLITTGTKLRRGRFFNESRLPSGGVMITAETWAGAMEYLKGRFQPK